MIACGTYSVLPLVLIVASYLIGSIPSGFLIARLFGVRDIRDYGSGNIGATNVARILGKQFFIPIFLFDAIKAFLNMYVLQRYGFSEEMILICAGAHLFGNGCSIFLPSVKISRAVILTRFFFVGFIIFLSLFVVTRSIKNIFSTVFTVVIIDFLTVSLRCSGGKGIATSVGLFAALQPAVLPLVFGVWLITFILTHTVGMASVAGVLALPLASYLTAGISFVFWFSVYVSIWVIIRHKKNIQSFLAR